MIGTAMKKNKNSKLIVDEIECLLANLAEQNVHADLITLNPLAYNQLIEHANCIRMGTLVINDIFWFASSCGEIKLLRSPIQSEPKVIAYKKLEADSEA